MKEAMYYQKLDKEKVRCELCPKRCVIAPDGYGFCQARKNIEGKLFSEIYARITSIALDPIEKKPLYHFHPGEYILSLGTRGCNFACLFCQNWQISQSRDASLKAISPEDATRQAKKVHSFGIAYTYNEPMIWYEFVLQTAKLAHKQGLKNVLVTNGFINQEPLNELIPFIDALNIDLKSIDNDFYVKYCKGELKPVLETIKTVSKSAHLELTNLIIPGLNDSEENFIRLRDWIFDNLGPETPLHFSRYFPCHKMDIPPTPLETLNRAKAIASEKLKNIYLGNV